MSVFRSFLATALASLAVACAVDDADRHEGSSESQVSGYHRFTQQLFQCRTAVDAHLEAPVAGASVSVSRGLPQSAKSGVVTVAASLQIALTREEEQSLRAAHPFDFAGGAIGAGGEIDVAQTRAGQHYASLDGTVSLDMDLVTAGAVADGSGIVTVTVDYGAPKVILPERIKALGKRTYRLALAACHASPTG